MRRAVVLGLVGLATLSVSANQQTPTNPPQPTFHATSTLATIDVVVTDDQGRHVTDLTKDDFEVHVGGKRHNLQQAVYVRADSAAPLAAGMPPTPAQGARADVARSASQVFKDSVSGRRDVHRAIAFVVDDLSLSFESTYYVRRALMKYIDSVEPGDLVAIIRTASGSGALQQFTTDTRLLRMAADRIQWDFRSRHAVSSFDAITPAQPGASRSSIDGIRNTMVAAGSLGAMQYVARGLQYLPGRKSIVLLSEGFPEMFRDRMEGGRVWNALTGMLDAMNRAGVVVYTIDARGLQTGGLGAEDNPQTRSMDIPGGGGASSGPPAGVTGGGSGGASAGGGGSSGGATGSGTPAGGAGPRMTGSGAGFLDTPSQRIASAASDRLAEIIDSQESLQFIANQTGGLAVANTNDLGRAIDRVIQDQQGYYLLGYDVPSEDVRSGWSQDGVKVRVRRPGLHVRSRQGFFGPANPRDVTQPYTEPLLVAALSPFATADVSARLTCAFWYDGTQPSVRAMFFIDANDLQFRDEPDGRRSAALDVAVFAADDNGRIVAHARRSVAITLTAEQYREAHEHGLVYRTRLALRRPGAYQVRAAVRDTATGRIGSGSQFFEVPETGKGKLALSGVLLKGLASGKPSSDRDDTLEISPAGLRDDALLAPTVRILHPGSTLVWAYEIYDGLGDPDHLQMSVALVRDGREVYRSAAAPVKAPKADTKVRVIPIGGSMELARSAPTGSYSLQVNVARQRRGKLDRRASQWVDFEVRR